MKVTATKDVHIRLGEPKRNGNTNLKGILHKGFSIEVAATKEDGESIDNNSTWYQDKNDDWYWSGGFEERKVISEPNDINKWVNFFGLNEIAEGIDLKSTTVAVIDSGINYNHLDLKGVCSTGKNFLWPGDDHIDNDGHGTHCSGIIAGTGKSRITGVAKGIRLIAAEVVGVRGMGINESALYNAIEWCMTKSNVISMSLGIPTESKRIHDLIKKGVEANKLFIAAIGNIGPESGKDGDYPALHDEVVSVGCLKDNFEMSDLTIRANQIDINVPGENIVSCYSGSEDSYQKESGTSMSTAIISGIGALFKAKKPSANYKDFKKVLLDNSETKKSNGYSYTCLKSKKIVL